MVVRPRALRPGEPEQIGEYRLSGVLGEGGQGVVYLGEGPSGARVAVKVLHARGAADAESQRRFLREADTARSVAPFCTARVLDVGTADDRPYVVSEYIPGLSLAEAVAADGPRTGSGLHRLAVATLTALAAIHRAGIVHRDFKPSNVILGPEGPVVIDFGIARVVGHGTTSTGLVGTPAYVSPEQLAGHTPGTPSDLFSWAATMVYAATGHPAFPGDNVPALLYAITTAGPDLTGVPDDLRPLLSASMTKDPAARPTATALLHRLTGEDSVTPPTTTPIPHPPGHDAPAHDAAGETRPVIAGAPVRGRVRRRLLWPAVAVAGAVAVAAGVLLLRPEAGGAEPEAGVLLYRDDFSERGNWDGYTFAPDGAGDTRVTHGYEIERGVYSIYADRADHYGAALSPVPAKEPAGTPERDVLIGVTAQTREGTTGRASFGLLCRWDEDVPNGYAFTLGLDGTARIVRVTQGKRLDVTPPVELAAPRTGQNIRVQARCRRAATGVALTLWIDGAKTLDTVDTDPPPETTHSQSGLLAQVPEADGGQITVSFDDFTLHRPG
ncbi:serine/threonine-protein kinase [Sphaerisporangium sp. B11E5]|uniref:serine/threonine-protein kinase n=1 Tax=Sphaerisporangium sp. B11E5 TaxID=3153563 RepID=UPI00325E5B4C